jgi:N-acetylglutamate synthase
MNMDFLESVEEAALNAWPAPRQILYDGWFLRFAGGYSKRANSVNIRYRSRLPFADKIAYCEHLYALQGLPTLFRTPEPFTSPMLLEALGEEGYVPFDPTMVFGRSIDDAQDLAPGLTTQTLPIEAWIGLRATLTGTRKEDWEMHRRIVECIAPEKTLLELYAEGQPVACGMAVVEGTLLGYFSIYTKANERQRGYGRMMMAALTRWGMARGATYGYLQVEGDNPPALAMYAKLGFARLYGYTYWKKLDNR